MIYIGADHRGWKLKNQLAELLQEDFGMNNIADKGAYVEDFGDDYVYFGKKVCENVQQDNFHYLNLSVLRDKFDIHWPSYGILICGSGEGMSIIANKFKGILASLSLNSKSAVLARQHNNANVLILQSFEEVNPTILYQTIVKPFLQTTFENEERHLRRVLEVIDYDFNQRNI